MAGFLPARHDTEAQPLVHVRREDRALERARDHVRREEEALVQAREQTQIRADLLPEAGRGEPVGAALDACRRAADIPADRGKSPAGVLNQ